MKEQIIKISIEEEYDVRLARETASEMAAEAGFDNIARGEIALAVSEICQNAFRHGEKGEAEIACLKDGKILRITISDRGAGIPNIDLAMREGFSTIRTSLGIGLEAAQRLMDKFEIISKEGEGTQVIMEKYLPMMTDTIEYGVVSVPDEHYNFNGDEFLIKEFEGDKVLLGVIDGIGQGYDAHAMSTLIKKFILKNYNKPLTSLILSIHSLLKESEITGGAAIALALLEPGQLTYLGIGDTHSYLFNGQITELPNLEGRVGEYQLPTLKPQSFLLEKETNIVLCTDGISTSVSEIDFDNHENAQKIANLVFNNFHKNHGDVTVLVTKIKA